MGRKEGGEFTLLLSSLVIRPLITHPLQDGATFLLLVDTPPTFGRSLRLLLIYFPATVSLIGGGGKRSMKRRERERERRRERKKETRGREREKETETLNLFRVALN